jgi:hypothetical protein
MSIPEIKSIPTSGGSSEGFAEAVWVVDEAIMTACCLPPHLLVVPPLGVEDIPPLVFMYVQAGGQLKDVEGALALWVRVGRPYYNKGIHSDSDTV